MSHIKLLFTIDKSYTIKAVLTSLPHIVFGFNSTKTGYPTALVRADFERWRKGIYVLDFATTDYKLVIREENRVYTFLPTSDMDTSEVLWLFLDELKLTNQKIDDMQMPVASTSVNSTPNIPAASSNKLSLVNVDYRISTIKSDLDELNEFLSHTCAYVVGVRGYWVGNTYLTFNITQVLCVDGKPYEPFVELKLINSKSTVSDENAHITVHDILGSFNNLSLRLYCKDSHIMTVDLNNFISKSVNVYLEGSEESMKKELTKRFYETSEFTLDRLEYKTSLVLDTSNVNCFNQLNKIMQIRKMQIIEGSGHWLNPLLFVVTKIIFQALSPTSNDESSDDFEKLEDTKDNKDNKETIDQKNNSVLKLINNVEKYYRKNPTTPNQIVFTANNTTSTHYNVHLLLTLEDTKPMETKPIESLSTAIHETPEDLIAPKNQPSC